MSTQDDADNEEIAFSRSSSVGPFGNLEDPMKTHVDLDTGLAFRRMCRDVSGGDTAKVLRNFIYLKVHGKTYDDFVEHASKAMRDKFFGTGPNEDQTGGQS